MLGQAAGLSKAAFWQSKFREAKNTSQETAVELPDFRTDFS